MKSIFDKPGKDSSSSMKTTQTKPSLFEAISASDTRVKTTTKTKTAKKSKSEPKPKPEPKVKPKPEIETETVTIEHAEPIVSVTKEQETTTIFDQPQTNNELITAEQENRSIINKSNSRNSFIPLQIGDVINRYPIPRAKYSENKRELISILTKDIYALRYHYFKDIGNVFCNSGLCCQVDGTPPIRYGVIIAFFKTNDKGNPYNPISAEVKIHYAGEDNYNSILDKWTDYNGLLNKVLKVRCKDDKFQTVEFDVIDINPFQGNQALHNNLLSYYEQNKNSIRRSVAKDMPQSLLAEALKMDDYKIRSRSTDKEDLAKHFNR